MTGCSIVLSPGNSLNGLMVAIATSVAMVTPRQEYRAPKHTPKLRLGPSGLAFQASQMLPLLPPSDIFINYIITKTRNINEYS